MTDEMALNLNNEMTTNVDHYLPFWEDEENQYILPKDFQCALKGLRSNKQFARLQRSLSSLQVSIFTVVVGVINYSLKFTFF